MLFLLVACSDTRAVTGRVVDIWGKPIPEATVVIEGVLERYRTDSAGAFRIEVENPISRLMVGKDGYIKGVSEAHAPNEEEDYDPVSFRLYPEPEKPGFYGVGRKAYVEMGHQRIQMVGDDLHHFAGVQDIPEEAMPNTREPTEFVFTTRLRRSEISQMNLHLSKMEFIERTRIKGVFGATDATVNLWVARDDVPFTLTSFGTREDYLIKTDGPLEPGIYAFHAHDVLHEEDERVLRELPREEQVAFPFEVR
jgi:hypothetical protein